MSDLLELVLAAHGGRGAWERARRISARRFSGGPLWNLGGHPGALDDVRVTVDLDREHVVQEPFLAAGQRADFTPERVAIQTSAGEVVAEQLDPRTSFAGHDLTSGWNPLQLASFSSSALWSFLAEPISLTFPGVQTEEIDGWTENGQSSGVSPSPSRQPGPPGGCCTSARTA